MMDISRVLPILAFAVIGGGFLGLLIGRILHRFKISWLMLVIIPGGFAAIYQYFITGAPYPDDQAFPMFTQFFACFGGWLAASLFMYQSNYNLRLDAAKRYQCKLWLEQRAKDEGSGANLLVLAYDLHQLARLKMQLREPAEAAELLDIAYPIILRELDKHPMAYDFLRDYARALRQSKRVDEVDVVERQLSAIRIGGTATS